MSDSHLHPTWWSRHWGKVSVVTGTACHLLIFYYLWRMATAPSFIWWQVALGVLIAYLLVDLITLLTHWTLDNYFSPDTPIIGQTVYFFREHHHSWDEMFERNWFEGNFENGLVSLVFLLCFLPFSFEASGIYAWIAISALGGAYITQIHKWAHDPSPPLLVRLLQGMGLIVSKRFHDMHHNDTRLAYGLFGAKFDALFEGLRLFEILEILIYLFTGAVGVETRLHLARRGETKLPFKRRFERVYWRLWYGFLARYARRQGATFHCMNWGYDDGALDIGEQPFGARYPLQLYHAVAAGQDLENKRIVDISCGRGGGITYLFHAHRPLSALGVDFAPENVAAAQTSFGGLHQNLAFEQGDAEAMNFSDRSIDALISVEASHCYGSRTRFLEEAHRVLRPGGVLLWTDFAPTEEVHRLRKEACALFDLVSDRDVTAEILAGMRADEPRRRALIDTHSHPLLRPLMRNFAAADDRCDTRQRFLNGTYQYYLFQLQKPQD